MTPKTRWMAVDARTIRTSAFLLLVGAVFLHLAGCKQENSQPAQVHVSAIRVQTGSDGIHIQTQSAEFVLGTSGYLRAGLTNAKGEVTLDEPGKEAGQEVSLANSEDIAGDFVFDLAHAVVAESSGKLGSTGKHVDVAGSSAASGLTETLTVEVYDDFPAMAILTASFRNAGQKDAKIESVTLQRHRLNASLADPGAAPHQMWSFHGSSLKWGKDDVLPIPPKFSQENPFGRPVETKDDLGQVGGGIPVVAFWTRGVGEAIGHLETLPLDVSIPVSTGQDGRVHAAVRVPVTAVLKPGEVFSAPRTFITVYAGDYYEPLRVWSEAVEREGLARPTNNDENYAVSWCGWGYESDVTPRQMISTIPKLKEMDIHWATLDDRWFNNYGDWQPRTDTFPGDAITKMVNEFHEKGIKLQIWWLPLGVEDRRNSYGARKYEVPEVLKQHPDWLVLNKVGKPARMARNRDSMSRGAGSARLLQTVDRAIHPRLGIRRSQARQHLHGATLLQSQAPSQVAHGLRLCHG
jgi:hypothetical protein